MSTKVSIHDLQEQLEAERNALPYGPILLQPLDDGEGGDEWVVDGLRHSVGNLSLGLVANKIERLVAEYGSRLLIERDAETGKYRIIEFHDSRDLATEESA